LLLNVAIADERDEGNNRSRCRHINGHEARKKKKRIKDDDEEELLEGGGEEDENGKRKI
jgi:hypothetical protein